MTVDELSAKVMSPLARCAGSALDPDEWDAGGQHGIWGGLVEADRASARAGWLAGTPVTALLKTIPAEHG